MTLLTRGNGRKDLAYHENMPQWSFPLSRVEKSNGSITDRYCISIRHARKRAMRVTRKGFYYGRKSTVVYSRRETIPVDSYHPNNLSRLAEWFPFGNHQCVLAHSSSGKMAMPSLPARDQNEIAHAPTSDEEAFSHVISSQFIFESLTPFS